MPKLPYIDRDNKRVESSHVVILGAGASRASFPKGDAHGNKLPLMNELIDILNLDRNIKDFESFFSEISTKPKYNDLVKKIKRKVNDYFNSMELPSTVTIYDYLVLSLRSKDIIASFNWDPLLLKAYLRNKKFKPLPEVVFLHGNVYMGVCQTDHQIGYLGTHCEKCFKPLEPIPLLYPISQKNYNDNPIIKDQWDKVTAYLEDCYFLTIFGYSAPKTDVEARKLLKQAWTSNESMEFSEIEIIDIKDEKKLSKNWSDFTIRDHYRVIRKFEESWLWQFPKQTCEALFDATMQNDPRKPKPFPKTDSIKKLHNFIMNLEIEELHF